MKTSNKVAVNILILLISLFFAFSVNAQSKPKYKILGSEIVRITDTLKSKRSLSQSVKTAYTHKVKGVSYPVMKSARGSFFIVRTSKKTQKKYKQYLKI